MFKPITNLIFAFLCFTNVCLSQTELQSRNEYGSFIQDELVQPDILDTLQLDSLIKDLMRTHHMVGYSASIFHDGKVFWHKNYGYARLDTLIPVTDSTLFMLASLSKPFVATAVMQLEENGLLDLDADINMYLPDKLEIVNPKHPEDSVTTKMLLMHTSSLNDNWSVLDPLVVDGDSPISLDSLLVGYFMEGGLWYSSSSYNNWSPAIGKFEYCNMGFALLAYLVECISNKNLEEYCQENIFGPLEMNNTSWFLSNLNFLQIAMPYKWNGVRYQPYGYYGFPDYPDGQLRTSNLQLINFVLAMMNGGMYKESRILKSSTVDKMFSRYWYDEENDTYQGLCWWEQLYDSHVGAEYMWGHTGHDKGVVTSVFCNPIEKYGFISLSNTGLHDNSKEGEEIIQRELANLSRQIALDIDKTSNNLIADYHLGQNYPNPFNPRTTINYELPITNYVDLSVYNLLGQKIVTLVSKKQNAGHHQVRWDASRFAGGIYYYRIKVGNNVQTRKMIYLK